MISSKRGMPGRARRTIDIAGEGEGREEAKEKGGEDAHAGRAE